jgi:hypothetical protein
MIATDIYQPAEWHDFFLVTGGGAAALAGLVFVAMSINLDVVAQDATHRRRAINMLTGFTGAFLICALALMGGQRHQAVGAEWFVVATVVAVIYVRNYALAARTGVSRGELRPARLAGSTTCFVAEMVGAAVLGFRPCCGSLRRRGRIDHPFRLHDFWGMVAARSRTRGQIARVTRRASG